MAVDPDLGRYVFEFAVPQVMQQELAAAVAGVFEAVGHHHRVFEMPQIEVVREVAADEQIELAVAVVIDPGRAVDVDNAARHPGGRGDVRKALALIVVEQHGRTAPLVNQDVVVAVVVEIAPHRPHRHAGAVPVDIRQSKLGRDILELATSEVMVQVILSADRAVADVDVRQTVVVVVANRNRRAHRRNLRHDRRKLRIEHGGVMDKVDAGGFGDFVEVKTVALDRGRFLNGRNGLAISVLLIGDCDPGEDSEKGGGDNNSRHVISHLSHNYIISAHECVNRLPKPVTFEYSCSRPSAGHV
jgi:hypothetical protein